jgi:hypothetical protein
MWGIVVLIFVSTLSTQTAKVTTEDDDIRVAETSLLTNLVVMQSTAGRSLCTDKPVACLGGDRGELAIALIAARNSPKSLQALARLHRYVLDASYGESFDQYVCEKGRSFEKYLIALRADKLRQQCVREFDELMHTEGEELEGSKVDYVCADVAGIRTHIRQSLGMTRNPPSSCEP